MIWYVCPTRTLYRDILCKTKDRVIVEYALRYAEKPLECQYQIVKRLPKA